MKLAASALLVFIFCSVASAQRIDYCKIYGKIYFIQNKNQADYKVFIDENEGFPDIIVYQQTNKLFADKVGYWYITQNRAEADYWIYIEPVRGFADFSISYTETESFAGCKQ